MLIILEWSRVAIVGTRGFTLAVTSSRVRVSISLGSGEIDDTD